MTTRTRGLYTPGAYSEEREGPSQAMQRLFKPIVNNCNVFIVKNLKKQRKKSPIAIRTIEINESFRKFLESH